MDLVIASPVPLISGCQAPRVLKTLRFRANLRDPISLKIRGSEKDGCLMSWTLGGRL